jgi:protein SCO1/2
MAGIGKPNFNLIDHDGHEVTEASYTGKWLLVYFGFTHCRVVCPRSLNRLTQVLESLPERLVEKLQPLYISVDPERDRPDVMKQFLEDGFQRFTGLTGSPEQVEAAKDAFKVFAQRKPDPDDPDGYAVPHTSFTYLIGPDGCYVTHWIESKSKDEIVPDLRQRLE